MALTVAENDWSKPRGGRATGYFVINFAHGLRRLGNELVAGNCHQHEAAKLVGVRANHNRVGRSDAIGERDADFVEVRPNLAEKNVASLEAALTARHVFDFAPFAERD